MTALCPTSRLSAITLMAALGSPAFAGPTYENASGGTFTFYGQFNPAYTSFDDGVDDTGQLADNESSSSRVGLRITQPFGENELTFRFETALGLRATDEFSQDSEPDTFDWDRTSLRHVDFIYRTASYGTFYAGQGSMAADGIGDRDLSGTGLASAVSIGDIAGSFQLRDSAGALSGIEVGEAFSNFDGSRRGRLRYDTPAFNGFTLGIAYGQDILSDDNDDDFYDIALGYEAELDGGIELEAGLGYQVRERDGSEDREDTFGSVSILLPSGFNATFAAGDRNTAGSYYYGKVGYIAKFLSVGTTAISLDYYSGSDAVSADDEADSIGLAIVQKFDDQNVEAYFGYRDYSYSDASATSFQDADSYIVGARWRF